VSYIGLSLNLNLSVLSFSRSRNPIISPYTICGSELEWVSLIKYLGIYYSFNLSSEHHIDFTVGSTLKVLGFIKRNTKLFSSVHSFRSLYIALVRFLLEYGVVVWPPYLAKDQLYVERIQNKCLSFVTYTLKMHLLNHDYSHIRCILNLPPLVDRHNHIDCTFINSLLNNSLDAPDLISQVSFKVPSHNTRNLTPFYIPSHFTFYNNNHPMHRMLRTPSQI